MRDFFQRLLWPADPPTAAPSYARVIDLAPTGDVLVVTYGDFVSCIPVTPDPWQKIRTERLALALRASPGADPFTPRVVGYENASGLLEDEYVWSECRLGVTAANVAALRATELPWTPAAEAAADAVGLTAEAVAGVRAEMVRLAAEDHAVLTRFLELAKRQAEVDPESDEGRAIREELTRLVGRVLGPAGT